MLEPAERQALMSLSKWWWVFIVTGIIWILLALVILQYTAASLVTVGYIVGFMLIATGVEEIFVASATDRLKWLWYIVGISWCSAVSGRSSTPAGPASGWRRASACCSPSSAPCGSSKRS